MYLRQHLSLQRNPSATTAKKPWVHILLETSENPVSEPQGPRLWSRAWGWTQIHHMNLCIEKKSLLHRVTIWKEMWARAHQQQGGSENSQGYCWEDICVSLTSPSDAGQERCRVWQDRHHGGLLWDDPAWKHLKILWSSHLLTSFSQ